MEIRVSDLAKARLNPEDLLIVKLTGWVNGDEAGKIKAAIQVATGHEKVLVISQGIELEIAGPYKKVVD
jgi:polynucleotide 5'-kinase involved in rRNA processing